MHFSRNKMVSNDDVEVGNEDPAAAGLLLRLRPLGIALLR